MMEHNDFNITGRVSFIDVKYTDKGTCIVRTCISKRSSRNPEEFMGLWIDMFGETAEKYAEDIKKGDSVNIIGKVETDKYIPTGKTKPVEQLKLKGWKYQKAMYDSATATWVPYDEKKAKAQEAAEKKAPAKAKDEETPWG